MADVRASTSGAAGANSSDDPCIGTSSRKDLNTPGRPHVIGEEVRSLYAGCSYFLELLDKAIVYEPGQELDIVVQDDTHTKRPHYTLYEDLQKTHTNAITRDSEIVAVSISEKAPDEPTGSRRDHAKFLVVENPRVDEHVVPAGMGDSQTKQYVQATTEPICHLQPSQTTRETVVFVLQKYQEALDKCITNFPFAEHVAVYSHLLRRVHDETLSHDERSEARQQMTVYVFTVSNNKMHRRLELGKRARQRNFFEVVAAPPSDFPTGFWHEDDIIAPSPATQRLPTNDEAEWLSEELKDLKQKRDARHVADEPIYGVDGRKRFHVVLSDLVAEADTALTKLHEATEHFFDDVQTERRERAKAKKSGRARADKQPQPIPKDDAFVDRVAKLVDGAMRSVRRLTGFMRFFRSLVRTHLQWLGTKRGIKSRRQKFNEGWQPPQPTDTQSAPLVDTLLAEDAGEALAEDDEDEDNTELAQHLRDFTLALDSASDAKTDIDTDMRQGGRDWQSAALKWLDLLTLHDATLLETLAFERQTPFQRRISQRIRSTKIAVVTIQQGEFYMGTRTSLASCVDVLNEEGARLDNERLQKIVVKKLPPRQKSHVATFWDSTYMKGTAHCEAILLALAALVSDRGVGKNVTETWLENNGIFAVKSDLLEMVKDMLPIVADSKRCCPACWTLCQTTDDEDVLGLVDKKTKLTVPGYHTKWSCVALPPFLPAFIGDTLLRKIKRVLRGRLHRLLRDTAEEEKKRSSSPNSRPGPIEPMDSETPMAELRLPKISGYDRYAEQRSPSPETPDRESPLSSGQPRADSPSKRQKTHHEI